MKFYRTDFNGFEHDMLKKIVRNLATHETTFSNLHCAMKSQEQQTNVNGCKVSTVATNIKPLILYK